MVNIMSHSRDSQGDDYFATSKGKKSPRPSRDDHESPTLARIVKNWLLKQRVWVWILFATCGVASTCFLVLDIARHDLSPDRLHKELLVLENRIRELEEKPIHIAMDTERISVTRGYNLTVTLEKGHGFTLFFLVPRSDSAEVKSYFSIGPGRIASAVVKLIRKDAANEDGRTLAQSQRIHNNRVYTSDLPGVCVGCDSAPREGKVEYEVLLEGLDGSKPALLNVDLVAIHIPRGRSYSRVT